MMSNPVTPDHVTPDNARQFALWVVQKLRSAGYESLWAGGCVRDQLLGIIPSDYDVATSATPEEVRSCFGRGRTLAIGAAFGVITVRGRRDQGQIEVATFRCDAEYSDGRHPDHVSFSTAREDAQRRDFTMNGLFYDPLEEQVIDYVGGRDDLSAGIVRAIGDPYQRIAEDKLRMLRAVRFATTFGFDIDADTQNAVRNEAAHITAVSAERIAAELRKVLVHVNRARGMQLLRDVQLLPVILPESRVFAEPPCAASHPDAEFATWANTLGILGRLGRPTFRVALAGLLWGIKACDADATSVDAICQRWKLSNLEQKGVGWMLAHERMVRNAETTAWPVLQRLLINPAIEELLDLAEAIALQVGGPCRPIDWCREKLALPVDELDPPPLITGDHLQRAGFQAGPLFRHILDAVRDAQLEGQISTEKEALAMAATIVTRPSTGQ